MRSELVDAVLARLGLTRPTPDLIGLRLLYRAWCESVPFDNTLKLIHVSEGAAGPLPGSTSDEFFEAWLEHGTGGTCWAGNGALHDLLGALGFEVERAIATMLRIANPPAPNHGSVIVTLGQERWIADASILSREPIAIPRTNAVLATGSLPRFEWLDGCAAVRWRMLSAPEGFHCRIDRIGAGFDEWDRLHQRTAGWSPFNYELSTRLVRGRASFGAAGGQRFEFGPDGMLRAAPLEKEARTRFLVDELGISPDLATRVPPDRPVPPRPL